MRARTILITAWWGLIGIIGVALVSGATWALETSSSKTLRVIAANSAAETGLIATLARTFESQHPGIVVELEFAGAMATIDRAREGRGDVVITHRQESEALTGQEGIALHRTLVMYNEFAIFGPANDPLHLRRETDIGAVLRRMASEKVPFMVPGRRSGTYKNLTGLWTTIGVEPNWPGYRVTDESPAATLRAAMLSGAHAFADVGTYLVHRPELGGKLVPLVRDNLALRNYYDAVVIDRARVPKVNQSLAEKFVDYLVSTEGQDQIRHFGEERFGAQIFVPAAELDEGLRARRAARELEDKSANLRRVVALAFILAFTTAVVVVLFARVQRLERATRRSEERFALAISGANDGIWDWDIVDDRAYFSSRLKEILNYRSDDSYVSNLRALFMDYVHLEDRSRLADALEDYLVGKGGELFEAECRWRIKSEEYRWVMVRGKALRDRSGVATRMSGSISDITQRKTQEETLVRQALYDTLTDLPNRTLLLDRLGQAMRLAARSKRTIAVIVLGLDRFKEINDTLGYDIGDQILKEVSARLIRALRGSDTIARLGGDEFAILLPDVAGEVYAHHVAKKIGVILNRPIELESHALHVGASLGIAMYPQHGKDGDELVRHADIAMFTAKRSATGCAFYDHEQDQDSGRRLALANELHEALEHDGLSLHYQPKIDLRTGGVTGVEALLRWFHPIRGPIPPDEIIPIAERTGLIKPLTMWVLDAALQQHVEWKKQGIDLKMAVNLSMWSLQDPKLTEEIQEALSRWNVPATRLELEITESAMMSDPKRTLEILTQLHEMGIGLSVDDYGTGFSSLAYLKRLPVGTIKIDKSFVMSMDVDESSGVIVRSTIELAHNLGLTLVAEGVENQTISDKLMELGCDTAQGYYYCRPNNAETCTKWLHESPWGLGTARDTSSRVG